MTIESPEALHRPKGQYLPPTGPLETDPFPILEEIGNVPPFWFDDPADVKGYWIVTRYAQAREILQDHTRFSAIGAAIPWVELSAPLLPVFSDPPQVQKYRRALVKAMSPTVVEGLKPRMEELCAEIIDRFAGRGHVEVVDEFARVFPITVFLEFFGMAPEKRGEFMHWSHRWMHDRKNQREYWQKIIDIVGEQINAKRGKPSDDLLGLIANETIDGQLYTHEEACSLAATVFIGGLDTVPTVISFGLRFLATHRQMRERLAADPSQADPATEEMLRLFPVALPKRRATHDFEFHGAQMQENDRILISIPNTGRDPDVYSDPLHAHFDRAENPHMSFGLGAHRCVGMNLARPELQVALRQWHERIPEYSLDQNADLGFQGGVLTLTHLPLSWDVRKQ